jgi:hypothetical protein
LHNADDASMMTFGSALGAERKENDDQEDSVVPGASQATTAAQGVAVSGADSG